jgi:peroxiredoxin
LAVAGENGVLIDVIADGVRSQENFMANYDLKFTLVSNPDKEFVTK